MLSHEGGPEARVLGLGVGISLATEFQPCLRARGAVWPGQGLDSCHFPTLCTQIGFPAEFISRFTARKFPAPRPRLLHAVALCALSHHPCFSGSWEEGLRILASDVPAVGSDRPEFKSWGAWPVVMVLLWCQLLPTQRHSRRHRDEACQFACCLPSICI